MVLVSMVWVVGIDVNDFWAIDFWSVEDLCLLGDLWMSMGVWSSNDLWLLNDFWSSVPLVG